MPKTDAKQWRLPEKSLDRFDRVGDSRRITRPIGHEDSVRLQCENVECRSVRRDHGQAASSVDETTQDVAFEPQIDCYHVTLSRSHRRGTPAATRFGKSVRFLGCYAADQILACHRGGFAGLT